MTDQPLARDALRSAAQIIATARKSLTALAALP
jgi:hypothetical protein